MSDTHDDNDKTAGIIKKLKDIVKDKDEEITRKNHRIDSYEMKIRELENELYGRIDE